MKKIIAILMMVGFGVTAKDTKEIKAEDYIYSSETNSVYIQYVDPPRLVLDAEKQLIFYLKENKEILRLTADGKVFYLGKLVNKGKEDKKIMEGLKKFIIDCYNEAKQ